MGSSHDAWSDVTPAEVKRFFDRRGHTVVTFLGFSDSGYEDVGLVLDAARLELSEHDPATTIVNCGATRAGIGAVYAVAKELGFETVGIVSSRARSAGSEISADVDRVFWIEDESWGGFMKGRQILSPTSRTVVENSDRIVCIGGGVVTRDEVIAARRQGKPVRFIAADMNHARASEAARQDGRAPPQSFAGAASEAFDREDECEA